MEEKDNNQTLDLARSRLETLDSKLDELLNSYGVPAKLSPNVDEIGRLLSISHLELKKMTAEECAEATYILRQASFKLRLEFNREVTRRDWANAQIDKAIAQDIQQQDKFMKYEQKRAACISSNSFAFKANELAIYAGARAQRIEGLSDKISDMARALNDLAISRKRVY